MNQPRQSSEEEKKDVQDMPCPQVTSVQDIVTAVQLIPFNVARALLGPRLLPILVYIMDQELSCARRFQLICKHHYKRRSSIRPSGIDTNSTPTQNMAGHHPYYVRRGWVDEEGQIRVIESSLKIMNRVDEVDGEEATDDDEAATDDDEAATDDDVAATDDDEAAGVYTYPAPGEDASNNPYTAGYFYLGEMIELVNSTPPSPVEDATPSILTFGEDGELDPLATATTYQPDPYSHLLLPPASTSHSLDNISNVYSQSLPYANPQTIAQDGLVPQSRSIAQRHNVSTRHDLTSTHGSFATGHLMVSLSTAGSHVTAPPILPHTGFAPLAPNTASSFTAGVHNAVQPVLPNTSFVHIAPNMTYPYRLINAATLSATSILSLPDGPRVGQPVPPDLHPIISAISNLKVIGKTEHPERKVLKKPYEGAYQTASRDRQLIRDHFASGTGLLKNDSPLREWYGDLRVFSAKMWEFLVVQKTRLSVGVKA